MSRYIKVSVNISEGQRKKLTNALRNKAREVSIQLGREDLNGEDVLALTKGQLNRMKKAYENRKGVRITMSPSQLKYNLTVEGGFLAMLASLAARALPFIASKILPALGVGA